MKKGEIYIASLDPTIGGEIKKTRPVIIVSNNVNNRYNLTITVIPITSNTERIYPFEVFVPKGVGNLPKDSKIKVDQIRTIDKSRIVSFIGELPEKYISDVHYALKVHLEIE
ncbi:MAG: type II toxin-antitoxin system PemK/MazF family toxin [Bacteroidetes bacterium]|nr:MAG: type II toxin-antitoxin system PemK/MazF family toxin [Bacteroidota bacterium]